MIPKKYLIINTYSSITGLIAEESLEFILSIASLEQEISVLFLENSGLKLIENQIQSQSNSLEALALFDLKNIYIEDCMLEKLTTWNLLINCKFNIKKFSITNLNYLYNNHDIILCY
jgi:sulfur relay (sulfurtransferase) DsrF/TusC family protein